MRYGQLVRQEKCCESGKICALRGVLPRGPAFLRDFAQIGSSSKMFLASEALTRHA
jgi:hypothetical protein